MRTKIISFFATLITLVSIICLLLLFGEFVATKALAQNGPTLAYFGWTLLGFMGFIAISVGSFGVRDGVMERLRARKSSAPPAG